MPQQTVTIFEPLAGLAQLASPEHIPATSFVTMTNMTNDGGAIRPRPGYKLLFNEPLSSVTSLTADANGCRFVTLDTATTPDEIYFTTASSIRKVTITGSANSTVYNSTVTASSDIRGIASNATHLFYCDYDNQRVAVAAKTPGSPSSLASTTTVNPLDIAIDASNSILYLTYRNTFSGPDTAGFFWTNTGGTSTRLLVFGDSATTSFGAIAVWPAKNRIYVGMCDNIAPTSHPGSAQINEYHTNGAYIGSLNTFTFGYPVGMYVDTSASRLYFTYDDGANSVGIAYATLDSNGDLTGTLLSAAGVNTAHTPRGVIVDSGVSYYADATATTGAVYSTNSQSLRLTSAYWWNHATVNMNGQDAPDDVVLLQYIRESTGGSDFKVWLPNRASGSNFYSLTPGYTNNRGSSKPDIFVMTGRTANPGPTDPIIATGNYGRASHAFMGRGLDTHQGGVLFAAGTMPFVFNFHAGEAAQSARHIVRLYNNPTGGNWRLTFNGQETANMAWNASGATVQAALEALSNIAPGDVTVSDADSSVSGQYDYTVQWGGTYANTGIPLLHGRSVNLTGFATDVICFHDTDDDTGEYLRGRGHPYGMFWLVPAGLPRPAAFTTVAANANASANLQGIYSYVYTYYSSALALESPPSPATMVNAATASYIGLEWDVPDLQWFYNRYSSTAIEGGPYIDYVRIYRKRLGDTLVTGIPDGVAADAQYKFVAEVQCDERTTLTVGKYNDNFADSSLAEDAAFLYKEYPPSETRYVVIHEQHAYYLPATAGNRTIWNSEPPLVGGIGNGELGYQYVRNDSYFTLPEDVADDGGTTAMRSFGGHLLVWTPNRLYRVDTSDIDSTAPYVLPIDGAVGCASHFCVVESGELPETPGGALFYPHPKAGMYMFDGTRAVPIARGSIYDEISTLSRVTHQDLSTAADYTNSWYYSSAVIDEVGNRIVMAVPRAAAAGVYCLVYHFDRPGWSVWEVPCQPLFIGREWESGTTQYDPIMLFGRGNALYKFEDGLTDAGQPFSYTLTTGYLSGGQPGTSKTWHDGVFFARRKTFGNSGNAAVCSVSMRVDGQAISAATSNFSIPTTGDAAIPFSARSAAGRFIELTLSGSHSTNNQTHPAILGYQYSFGSTGTRGRIRRAR